MDTLQKHLESGFGAETTAEEVAAGHDLSGKVIVVTGGHGGIGFETTRVLSKAGATIVVGARDPAKAKDALAGLKHVEALPLDLAAPGSIDRFAREFLAAHLRLDVLINNAGIMATPLARDARGYEMQFATNHLGHFQLTKRLWDALSATGDARVVTLTSAGHRFATVDLDDWNFERRAYDKWRAYGQSKSANSLFSVELDRRGRGEGIRAFAVHPGRIVATDLIRHFTEEDMKASGITRENGVLKGPPGVFTKSVPQGAATTVWCAVSPQLEGKGGVYCEDCDVSELVADDAPVPPGVRGWAVDKDAAKALWDLSETLIA